ncbi:MAG: hypothetical protein ACRDU0_01860 [Mycobacterium sp.]
MRVKVDEEYWAALKRHTGTRDRSAPFAVMLMVAALLGDDKVKASWAAFEPADTPATWSVFVVTADRLLYAKLKFDAEAYDFDTENQRPGVVSAPTTLEVAWARRLTDVVRLEIGKYGAGYERGPRDWFPVGGVHLIFSDSTDVDLLIDQTKSYDTDRSRSDDFIEAVRAGAGL